MQGVHRANRWWLKGLAPLLFLLACALGSALSSVAAASDPGAGLASYGDVIDTSLFEDSKSEPAMPGRALAESLDTGYHVAACGALRRPASALPYPPHNPRAPPVR